MKALTCLVLAAMLAAVPAARAQTVLAASSAPPPPGSALPPPGIDDPGQQPQAVPLPDTGIRPSQAPAAREQQNPNRDSTDVEVRTNAQGDTVEEYKRNGQVYMVRITPKNGVPQTYMTNSPNGSLVHDPKLGPVSPVYYTIYQWGGSPKARPASASSGGH